MQTVNLIGFFVQALELLKSRLLTLLKSIELVKLSYTDSNGSINSIIIEALSIDPFQKRERKNLSKKNSTKFLSSIKLLKSLKKNPESAFFLQKFDNIYLKPLQLTSFLVSFRFWLPDILPTF